MIIIIIIIVWGVWGSWGGLVVVRVCCVVWVLRGALLSVGVSVSEGRCVCDELLRCAIVLHCWVGGDYVPNGGDVCCA